MPHPSKYFHALDVQLNVDDGRMPLDEAALVWFDTLTRVLAPAERAELAGRPAATRINPYSDRPQGVQGELYGLIELERPNRAIEMCVLSDEGLAWLRAELAGEFRKVSVWVGRFTEGGFLGNRVLHASVWPLRRTPGWLVLDAQVPAERLTDPETGRAEQRRWLGAIRAAADRLDPSFGQIEYWRDKGRSALERFSVSPDLPADRRDPQLSIPLSRERLRGYSWLTIVAREVADQLGGPAALAATGAFAEVEPLSGGGVWLLATDDFRDYGMPPASAVFRALAPALPPGLPVARNDQDQPPTFVVIADPSQV